MNPRPKAYESSALPLSYSGTISFNDLSPYTSEMPQTLPRHRIKPASRSGAKSAKIFIGSHRRANTTRRLNEGASNSATDSTPESVEKYPTFNPCWNGQSVEMRAACRRCRALGKREQAPALQTLPRAIGSSPIHPVDARDIPGIIREATTPRS